MAMMELPIWLAILLRLAGALINSSWSGQNSPCPSNPIGRYHAWPSGVSSMGFQSSQLNCIPVTKPWAHISASTYLRPRCVTVSPVGREFAGVQFKPRDDAVEVTHDQTQHVVELIH